MKRSRVFLSLTTCVLAIAAFAASKQRNQITVGYHTGAGVCHQEANVTATVLHNGARAHVTTAGSGVHTPAFTSACVVPVYTGTL